VLSAALVALNSGCGGAPRARLYPLSDTEFGLQPPAKPPELELSTPAGASQAEKFELLSARFAQLLAQSHTPGAAVALVLKGKLAFSRGFGVRSRESSAPVDADTLFRLASTSKPLLALAALRLVEQGKLELDQPIVQKVPYFTRADALAARAITLRQLLNHTAGIPDYALAPCSTDNESIQHFFMAHGRDPLTSPPGWFSNYSNHGYALAAAAIAEASGQPFERAVGELVFSPLGMKTATYDGELAKTLDHATGHDGEGRPQPFPMADCEPSHAAGGVYANVVDFARVLEVLLERDGRLLSSATLEQMQRAEPDLADLAERTRAGGGTVPPDAGWGLGLQIRKYRGVKVVGHSGVSAGYSADFVVVPELGLASVALANSQQAPVQLWARALEPFVEGRLEPARDEPPPQPNWDEYVGAYTDPFGWLGHVRIVKEGAAYYLDLEGGQPVAIPGQLKGQLRKSPDGAVPYIVTRFGVAQRDALVVQP
jgi:CubicO group peptidase (beta-lactamase class C family)